jgi:hypothetical protein
MTSSCDAVHSNENFSSTRCNPPLAPQVRSRSTAKDGCNELVYAIGRDCGMSSIRPVVDLDRDTDDSLGKEGLQRRIATWLGNGHPSRKRQSATSATEKY